MNATATVINRFAAMSTALVIVWVVLSLVLPAAEFSLFNLVGGLYAGTGFASIAGISAGLAVAVYCVGAYRAATATYLSQAINYLAVWGLGGAALLVFGPLLGAMVVDAMRTASML